MLAITYNTKVDFVLQQGADRVHMGIEQRNGHTTEYDRYSRDDNGDKYRSTIDKRQLIRHIVFRSESNHQEHYLRRKLGKRSI
jgi:hypothetical protein